jgi:hypothetical protein
VVIVRSLVLLSLVSFALAQTVETGPPQFTTPSGGPFDTVNVGNLNILLNVPVLNKPGRGIPFSYSIPYNGAVWTPGTTWLRDTNWGWGGTTQVSTGKVIYKVIQDSCRDIESGLVEYYDRYNFTSFYDQQGKPHKINVTTFGTTLVPGLAITPEQSRRPTTMDTRFT